MHKNILNDIVFRDSRDLCTTVDMLF